MILCIFNIYTVIEEIYCFSLDVIHSLSLSITSFISLIVLLLYTIVITFQLSLLNISIFINCIIIY